MLDERIQKTFCEQRPQRMHLSMAIVVTAALVAARGGVPGALTRAGRGFIHHTHTPCSPIHYPDAQANRATKRTQATGGPSQPQGTHPLIPNPADGWQVCSKAGRGPHSPIPTALRTPLAVPSAAKTTGTATTTLRSPRQPHLQISAAAPTTTPQRARVGHHPPLASPRGVCWHRQGATQAPQSSPGVDVVCARANVGCVSYVATDAVPACRRSVPYVDDSE